MNGTVQKAVKTAARAEQAILRAPLTVLDEQVLARFAEHSKLRAVVGRGIDVLDSVARRATGAAPAATPVSADEVEQRAAHLLQEQQKRPLAGELAEDGDLRRVQAQLKAKHAAQAEHETD